MSIGRPRPVADLTNLGQLPAPPFGPDGSMKETLMATVPGEITYECDDGFFIIVDPDNL